MNFISLTIMVVYTNSKSNKVLRYFLSICLISFALSQSESDSLKIPEDHISLTIHESLLNTFFQNIGEIRGEGTNAVIDYSWFLLEPRVEIEEDQIHFYAKVRAKTKNFRVTRDVVGNMSVTFDQESNILDVKVDKADVILDIDIFGKNVVLGKVDIAKQFSKSLQLNGPQSIEDEINFKLPNGSIRKMDVVVSSYDLKLIKDAIILSTTLAFKIKE